MSDTSDLHAPPSSQERQSTLSWRFDFATYAETRHFLDQMADLSKHDGYYPNVSFGKTYVNVSIDAEGQAELAQRNSNFICVLEALAVADKA